jgi:hypothetical protein
MSDLEALKKMLYRVGTTHFDDWDLNRRFYGATTRTMTIGCPDGHGAAASLMFDDKGTLLEFKVYEANGFRCDCEYCKPFHSGSDSCGCDHIPCDHDKFVAPVQKVFVPTEFFTKVPLPKKGKKVRKPAKKSTKKRSRK